MEYYVEQLSVKIADQNDSWVALDAALDKEDMILNSSTQEVKNGTIVRLSE